MLRIRVLFKVVVMLSSVSTAFASDGYFSIGYGTKSQGIGGIGIALPQDGLAAAINPAGTAFVPDRADVGLTWFSPDSNAQIDGNTSNAGRVNGVYDGNGQSNSFIPEFGYIKKLDQATTVGVSVYSNGGINTQYANNPYDSGGIYSAYYPYGLVLARGSAGISLEQWLVSPSVAYKLNEQNALGLALNFAYQRFSAEGLGMLALSSNRLTRVTDTSTGWGIRLGWTGQVTPDLTLGATWASKINTSGFSDYSRLFANGGRFDIPENYGAGLAYKFAPAWTFAADISRIKFSSVSPVVNPPPNPDIAYVADLGSPNGVSFGWRDITVVKLGVSYDYTPNVTLRAGYNHSTQAIPDNQTFYNIVAPISVQDHLTLGCTWSISPGGELSVAYTHGFKNAVNGARSIPAWYGGGNANISMKDNSFGLAYGWKF